VIIGAVTVQGLLVTASLGCTATRRARAQLLLR
jgi:hypothetical protein